VSPGVDVVVSDVAKSFDDGRITALDGVSLRVEPGELVALTGASGSGKSTLLNLIGALDRPDRGSIAVGGRPVERLDDPSEYRAGTVGFVFQFHNLIATLTALENVQIPMLGRVGGRGERERRAQELLEKVALGARTRSLPPTLSGGERQRVAIARALANAPELLLADEPTGALDSETGRQILDLIRRVREEGGMTVLLVTNDDEVAGSADRVLHLRDGRIAAATSRARLIQVSRGFTTRD
jgi:putative ABC transport system ATP-binding protein